MRYYDPNIYPSIAKVIKRYTRKPRQFPTRQLQQCYYKSVKLGPSSTLTSRFYRGFTTEHVQESCSLINKIKRSWKEEHACENNCQLKSLAYFKSVHFIVTIAYIRRFFSDFILSQIALSTCFNQQSLDKN